MFADVRGMSQLKKRNLVRVETDDGLVLPVESGLSTEILGKDTVARGHKKEGRKTQADV